MVDRTRSWFDAVFDADLRSLAAFRIVLATVVLIDLIGKCRNLRVFYTDDGVLSRRILLAELRPWSISFNLVSGTFLVEALLFGITAIAALCLLVGYRSRLASILVWAMVLSIQWRNPFVLHAADELLRVLLFWGMFLPLGAVWSLDRARQGSSLPVSNRFVSVGVAGLYLQIAFMYWFAVLFKTGREWRVDGTALSYALSSDHLVSPTGSLMLQFPELLKVLTFGTMAIELFAPFLLLSPFFKGPVRTLGVILVTSLHLGILVTMNIGYFPLLSAFSVVCFLPAWFWNRSMSRVRDAIPSLGRTERFEERMSSFLQTARRQAHAISGSLDRLTRGEPARSTRHDSRSPSRIGFADGARSLVDRLERHAGHTLHRRSSPGSNLLAAFFLVYVFVLNVTTVTDATMPLPSVSGPMSVALGLDQRWAMYSPRPAQYSYWFTIPAVLANGNEVDLLPAVADQHPDRATSVSWDKPGNVNETYRDMYWLRYLTTLTRPGSQERLLHFGGYVCRSWNEWYPDGESQLQTFDIMYFTQPTLADGERGDIEQRVLWQHRCR